MSCAPGATFVSASQSCTPAAASSSASVPTSTVLYLSGSSAETLGGLALTNPAGISYTSDHLGTANAAMSLALGSFGVSAPLSQLPTGGSARTMSAFVKCAPPVSSTGRTIIDTWDGSTSPASEHVMLLGLAVGSAPLVMTAPYTITTLAGGGATGTTSGNVLGVGTNALFAIPSGVAIDGYDNIFVTDRSNNLIKQVFPNGTVILIAGGGGGTIAGSTDGIGEWSRALEPSRASLTRSPLLSRPAARNERALQRVPGHRHRPYRHVAGYRRQCKQQDPQDHPRHEPGLDPSWPSSRHNDRGLRRR